MANKNETKNDSNNHDDDSYVIDPLLAAHNPVTPLSDSRMKELTDVAFFYRKRYYALILFTLSNLLTRFNGASLQVAMLELTYDKTTTIGNQTFTQKAEFEWSMSKKSSLLATYSFGLLICPVGSLLTAKFGAVTVFSSVILTMSLQAILAPLLLTYTNFYVFFVSQLIEGMAEGLMFSSGTASVYNWSIPAERSRFVSTVVGGFLFGIAIAFSICGFIGQRFGWKTLYYFSGSGPFLCSMLMFAFVSNTPAKDKLITENEKLFMISKNEIKGDDKNNKKEIPYKAILKSKPVWALLNERFVESWSVSFSGGFLPLFIKDVCNTDTIDTTLLTSIPNMCSAFTLFVGGFIADYLRPRLGINTVHRIFLLFAQFSAATLLITAGLSADFTTSMICFSLCRLLFSIADISYGTLPIDIGGEYSGFITGLAVVVMSIGFTLNSAAISWIITNHTFYEWITYFFFLSAFNIYGGIAFVFFGSSDLQPWAMHENHQPTIG